MLSQKSEIWKQIPEYENIYSVSNKGRIRKDSGHNKGKILKNSLSKSTGYFRVNLYENAISKTINVHKLVILSFVGPGKKDQVIRHLDDNKQNNNLENLCWGSRKENSLDAIKNKIIKNKNTGNFSRANQEKIKGEKWKIIPLHPKYYVSNKGRIKSKHKRNKGLIMSQSTSRSGYKMIGLTISKNKTKTIQVHKLVIETFKRPKKDKEIIRHKDGNKNNNCIENLEFGTYQDNMLDEAKRQRYKFNDEQINAIRKDKRVNLKIAKDFGVSKSLIDKIKNNSCYKHV